jgi:hypothetical protein
LAGGVITIVIGDSEGGGTAAPSESSPATTGNGIVKKYTIKMKRRIKSSKM